MSSFGTTIARRQSTFESDAGDIIRLRKLLRSGRVLTAIAWTSLMMAALYFLGANTVTDGSVAICLRGAAHFLLLALLTGVSAYLISFESSKIWARFYRGTKWSTLAGEVGKVVCINSRGTTVKLDFGDYFQVEVPLSMLTTAEDDESAIARMQSIIQIKLFRNRQRRLLFWSSLFVDTIVSVAGALFADQSTPSQMETFISLSFCLWLIVWQTCTLIEPDRTDYPNEQVKAYSSNKWQTSDGRIGIVRWVNHDRLKFNADDSEERDEYIVLKFATGAVERWNKKDLISIPAEQLRR